LSLSFSFNPDEKKGRLESDDLGRDISLIPITLTPNNNDMKREKRKSISQEPKTTDSK
jgi:hypothetical protein